MAKGGWGWDSGDSSPPLPSPSSCSLSLAPVGVFLAVLLLSVFSCSDPLAGWLRKKQKRALGALYHWAPRESTLPLLDVFSLHFQTLVRAPRGVSVMHVTQGRSQDPAVLKGEGGVYLLLLLPWDHGTPGVREKGSSSDAAQGMEGLGMQVYLGRLKAGSAQTRRDPTLFPSIPGASPVLRTPLVCGPSVGSHPFQVFPLSE